MKKLPIGTNTFSDIINDRYIYVDKTQDIHRLITSGKAYFLSRPRRFGKSLLISILGEIFSGNKELFKGLWIYKSDYDWKKYPVIRLDMSQQKATSPEQLKIFICAELDNIAKEHGFTLTHEDYYIRFKELLLLMKDKGKVVVLIDEYDKPLIDHLTDIPLAIKMREILKGFYSILKGNDEHLKFVLLTGVSKFSKAGVFSEMNHLNDITMSNKYSSMLGLTQKEIKEVFKEYIVDFCEEKKISKAKLLNEIEHWYNGYRFSENEIKVFNPFSTLLAFDNKSFKNYWFETGTPTFLVSQIKEKQYDIRNIPAEVPMSSFSTYELENLNILPLLFQTGYLTINNYDSRDMIYTLDYPNYEVKKSFLSYLLDSYSKNSVASAHVFLLVRALKENNFDKLFQILNTIFSTIPYDIHIEMEKYYQSLFYLIFTLAGSQLEADAEKRISAGRIDVVLKDRSIYIFEFKFGGTKEEALQQIKDKKYYEPYLNRGKDIYLVGAVFENKNIGAWMMERVAQRII